MKRSSQKEIKSGSKEKKKKEEKKHSLTHTHIYAERKRETKVMERKEIIINLIHVL